MARITLITGGARSGKSTHALEMGEAIDGRRVFVATAEALDEGMAERIALHREERDHASWVTIEEPLNIAGVIEREAAASSVVLVDCLTLWLSNLMMGGREIKPEADRLMEALKSAPAAVDVMLVTNEVGMGIVPLDPMARAFRDEAGRFNARIARMADRVIMSVCGIAVNIKGAPL